MAAASSPDRLSCISSVQHYVNKLITDVPGMKVLLLDEETTSIISLVYTQSQIIQEEVFLVERLDAHRDDPQSDVSMHHLRAIVLMRPTASSVESLIRHLRAPKYKEYHVFMTNVAGDGVLRELAEADEFELIKQVQEYYADFFAVNPDLWHLNLKASRPLYQSEVYWDSAERSLFRRNVQGVLAVLLSMKRRPVVRFQKASELAKRLAFEVSRQMDGEAELFHFQQGNTDPLLLVLDRRDDPVTPLLTQWTYQAMVHELLHIENNRVDMSRVPGIRKEQREIVLACHQDRFFKGSMFLNFGDLGASIKDLVEEYQRKVKSNQKLNTIEDMQRFVENYPEFRSMSGNVSKHVAIMTELSRLVDLRDLMPLSEVEQELACTQDHSTALEAVLRLLDNPRLSDEDRLRLVILYALRYETSRNELPQLKALLTDKATTAQGRARVRAVDAVLNFAGAEQRSTDLYGNRSLMGKISSLFGSGIKGVDNIYTQHTPVLSDTLAKLAKGKLKTTDFPYVDGQPNEHHEDVFVFIVGGCTYEEALAVHRFNEENTNGIHVILGGSCIHNSHSFLNDVLDQHDSSGRA